jgi:NADH:ubiquinone oxidoreductase subunit 5 (subunit L)/multisubunit Na+/H+ antiporter MnhA subunit
VIGIIIKEEWTMSFRTIVLIAASVIVGIACIGTGSTGAFARDAQMSRLDHKRTHHHPINHGRSAHAGSMGKAAPQAR